MTDRSKTVSLRFVLLACSLVLLVPQPAQTARLKDLADIRGARSNHLIGYGLVVGLAGTGDDASAGFSIQSTVTMLKRLGAHVDQRQLRLRNVAAVVVTATLPPFAGAGQRLDVTVSSIGNANSLEGGTLLATPLKGADLRVYAVGQGPLSVGGYLSGGRTGSRRKKNHTTVGRVPGGALIEREITVKLPQEVVEITLRRPDFTTAVRIAAAIETELTPPPQPAEPEAEAEAEAEAGAGAGAEAETGAGAGAEADAETDPEAASEPAEPPPPEPFARVKDAGRIQVRVPVSMRGKVAQLIARVEVLTVDPDIPTRVVINERTGTVVLGEGVRIAPVAIAHGGITIEVRESLVPSQPNAFGRGETVVVPDTTVATRETPGQLHEVAPGASLGDVVKALNALGVSPRDLVAILQTLKTSGALQAELEIQ